jgi:hypothetical protein
MSMIKTVLPSVEGSGTYELHTNERDFDPMPAKRLLVAIDGTYARASRQGFERQHFVLAGRVDRDGRFALVAPNPESAVELMKTTLHDHGLTTQSRSGCIAAMFPTFVMAAGLESVEVQR